MSQHTEEQPPNPSALILSLVGIAIAFTALVAGFQFLAGRMSDSSSKSVEVTEPAAISTDNQPEQQTDSNKTAPTTTYTGTPFVVDCKDVTSYDYEWNNDMLCTRSDGSQFYTSYDGANYYLEQTEQMGDQHNPAYDDPSYLDEDPYDRYY